MVSLNKETPQAPEPPKQEVWSLRDVPSQHIEKVYNKDSEELLDLNQAIVRILNELEEIKKFLAG